MSRPINILFCLLGLGITTHSYGDDTNKPIKVIDPDKKVTTVQAAAIDTEHFELGVYAGLMAVEDFNTNPVTGISFSYHISRKFLAQVNYGRSSVERAAFEEFNDQYFLEDYDFKYVNLLAGYNLLDGRSFLGKRHKFNSAIYLMAGVADVSFANNDSTGMVLGVSYRAVITDWLTLNLDFRDTIFNREFLNDEKKTNNTEVLIGFNALF